MALTVVLAVGLDSSFLADQSSALQSAGYFVASAESIREAIVQFRDGDFDLILLGDSIPAESRERLTFLIRTFGSRIPVVCVTDCSSDFDSYADATIRSDSANLIQNIGELIAQREHSRSPVWRD